MKKMAKILLIGLGFGLVTAVLGFLTSKPAPAQSSVPVTVVNTPLPVKGTVNANIANTPVPVTGTVNVNIANPPLVPQLASDTVTLQTTSFLSASCSAGLGSFVFDRLVVKSGGTVVPFTIPPGKVLVATSFDWSATGSSAVANEARTALLFRATSGGTNGASAQSTAVADSNGKAGGAETFPSGIVVQDPGMFCLRMDTPVTGEALSGVLQGFLAPNK
jgi:hypothetical protein